MRVLTDLTLDLPTGGADTERFAALRASEYGRLDESGHAYLDYTGAGLYGRSQIERHHAFLARHLVGNPHSANPTSSLATEAMEEARRRVLAFFGADPADYTVVFTANASAAIKLLGEAYRFGPEADLILMADNHNSVNGLRRYAEAAGAPVRYLGLDAELRLAEPFPAAKAPEVGSPAIARGNGHPDRGARRGLFAFPGQSNFSGVRHPLNLIDQAHAAGYDVLLDAAALVPTRQLDLARTPADFVAVSFYKMFGFPTGVGVLIARSEALARLARPWFAGGTVDFVSVQSGIHQLSPGAEGFEDGTPNFLGVAAVATGLAYLEAVGVESVGRHVARLTGRLLERLAALRYADGRPVLALYGPAGTDARGGTVAFNVLDRRGRPRRYAPIENAAGERSIHLRGGCFCNPGAAEVAFAFPADRSRRCFEQLPPGTFDLDRLADCVGPDVAVGALRASLGIASNERDVDRLVEFLAEWTLDAEAREP